MVVKNEEWSHLESFATFNKKLEHILLKIQSIDDTFYWFKHFSKFLVNMKRYLREFIENYDRERGLTIVILFPNWSKYTTSSLGNAKINKHSRNSNMTYVALFFLYSSVLTDFCLFENLLCEDILKFICYFSHITKSNSIYLD